MKRVLIAGGCLLLAVVVSTAPAAQDVPGGRGQGGRGGGRGAAPRTRKAVLAWADTRNGIAQHDSVSHALAVIERLGYESGAYDTFIRTDSNIISKHPLMTDGKPASGGPSLTNVDAIFFLGHRDVPLDAQQKADLLSFVKDDGKGFVAAHTATTAFLDWPEFGELLGARYDGHPWNTAYGSVINEDPAFPATKHLPRSSPSPTSSIRRRSTPATRFACCSGSTCRRCRRTRSSTARTATSRWPGRRRTARGACSTRRSDTRPRRGTIRDVYRMYFEALKWSLGMTEADVSPRPLK